MKKKIIIIVLLVVLIAGGVFAGLKLKDKFFNKTEEPPKTEEPVDPATVDVTTLPSYQYNELFKSGKYIIKYEGNVTLASGDIDATVTMAQDGANMLLVEESNGSKSQVLTIGDKSYIIDDVSKSYIEGTISNKEMSIINFGSLEYSGSGTETLYGKEMSYDEYTYDIGTLKYYFFKEELFAIKNDSEIENTTMNIIQFSGDVTEDMFKLPEGYTGY